MELLITVFDSVKDLSEPDANLKPELSKLRTRPRVSRSTQLTFMNYFPALCLFSWKRFWP